MSEHGSKETWVLLVDDDANDRYFLSWALQNVGSPLRVVHEAPDGERAISYLSGEGQFADREKFPLPGVLLLDLRMPVGGGFEVLHWLEKNPVPGLIISVLTGSTFHVDRHRASRMGVRHYYLKPIGVNGWSGLVDTMEKDLL